MIKRFIEKPAHIEAFQVTEELAIRCLEDGHECPWGLSMYGSWNKNSRIVHDTYISLAVARGARERATLGMWVVRHMDGSYSAMTNEQIHRHYDEII